MTAREPAPEPRPAPITDADRRAAALQAVLSDRRHSRWQGDSG